MFHRLTRLLLILVLGTVFVISAPTARAATLEITDLIVTPSDTEVTLQWTTNIMASSQVLYGTTAAYGSETAEINQSPRVTQHSVTVTGLQPCTTYHLQAKSVSLSYEDTIGTSPDQVVTTAGCTAATPVPQAPSTADVGMGSGGTDDLAETGPVETAAFLIMIAAALAIILAVTQLRKPQE